MHVCLGHRILNACLCPRHQFLLRPSAISQSTGRPHIPLPISNLTVPHNAQSSHPASLAKRDAYGTYNVVHCTQWSSRVHADMNWLTFLNLDGKLSLRGLGISESRAPKHTRC